MAIDPEVFNKHMEGTLSTLLGLRIVEATPDRVVAELTIRDDLRTVGGAVHGGTLMALADTVGAVATVVNLPPGRPPARSSPRPTSSPPAATAWCGRRPRRSTGASGPRSGRRGSRTSRAGCCR